MALQIRFSALESTGILLRWKVVAVVMGLHVQK